MIMIDLLVRNGASEGSCTWMRVEGADTTSFCHRGIRSAGMRF